MNNKLKEIRQAAGFTDTADNRSFYVKAVNTVLETGLVTITVHTKGYHLVRKATAKRYNITATAAGWTSRAYKQRADAFDILTIIGTLLQHPEVKKHIDAYVSHRPKCCQKCNGAGYIDYFKHVCNGICFDCCGTGHNMKADKTIVEINTPSC